MPSRWPRVRTGSWIVLILAMVMLVIPTAPAEALFGATICAGVDDPFLPSPANCVSVGNNYTHTYQLVGVRSDIATSFRSMVADYDSTDLVVYERDPADVIVMDNSYGSNGLVGWVNCPPSATTGSIGPTRWCYGQYLRFNLSYPTYLDTSAERQRYSCHEFGHTVGLNHNNGTTCLNNTAQVISSTERSEINGFYLPY